MDIICFWENKIFQLFECPGLSCISIMGGGPDIKEFSLVGGPDDELVGWPMDTNSMDMGLSKFQETVKGTEAWHAAVHGVTKSRTLLSH